VDGRAVVVVEAKPEGFNLVGVYNDAMRIAEWCGNVGKSVGH
jgi:hypothetical protein